MLFSTARADPAVQDAQRFGDRLHLRIAPGQASTVLARLRQAVAQAGGEVSKLEMIPPSLEDVFIAMASGRDDEEAG